ncbi:type VI secretion system-associated protein TagF [Desulfoluna sp.]|uniref:type VI secretion system-associated protein TagF n=1 Tax=Desulfoluna sp. TaxID=2045199 RepID=UPI0026199AE4|nr:type VI secretion system-associated protein TagF [Desulfoluna sp.]
MFGLIGRQKWNGYLSGKHPVAGDFLQLGRPTPLLKGFSGWMEKGYEGGGREICWDPVLKWNFWARGPNGEWVCGMMKASCDNHRRRYPLMIVGAGSGAASSEHWDLLPYACQETWTALACLAESDIRSVDELKKKVIGIRWPDPSWGTLYRKRERDKDSVIYRIGQNRGSEFMDKMNNIEGLARRDYFQVPLDVCEGRDVFTPASKFLRLLKSRSAFEPTMVFMGGSKTNQRMLCLKRPLLLDDFYALWSVDGKKTC